MTDRFEDYRDSMHASLIRYAQHAATIAAIEVATRHRVEEDRIANPRFVGGTITPLDYDLGEALEEQLAYRLARSRRDSARRAAVMWGIAAQVEAEARHGPHVGTQGPSVP